MKRPDNYVTLQHEWSACRSAAIRRGAQERVRFALSWAHEAGLSAGAPILVIGPQHGYELEQFRASGVSNVLGVHVVPEFCDDCRKLGFECIEGEAERLPELVEPGWNIHASHSLEHCYDLPRVVEGIKAICHEWCFVNVPIEPSGSRDDVHFSFVRDSDHFINMLLPWWPVRHVYRPPTNGKGNLLCLFVRPPTATPEDA